MRTILIATAFVLLALLAFILLRRTPRQIALTFDDLPAHGDLLPGQSRLEIVQSILATLNREHLPPTYGFVNGRPIDQNPTLLEVLKAWRTAGHPLANHTWSHPALSQIASEQFTADVARNEPLLQSLMGAEDWHYLRYPYLDEGDTPAKRQAVQAWLQQNRYQVAQVTQDFADYLWNAPYSRCVTQQNEASIATLEQTYLAAASRHLTLYRILSRLRYGREIPLVVLLHVGTFDAHMLPRLIALYRSRGLTFVTLQQAQSDPAYRQDPAATLRRGASILNRLASLRDRIPFTSHRRRPINLNAICPNTP